MTIQEISKELKIPQKEVKEILKSALRKCWNNMERLFPNSSKFERMEFMGRAFKVETHEDWQDFFKSFPEDIRMEALESIKESEAVFKNIDCKKFLNPAT